MYHEMQYIQYIKSLRGEYFIVVLIQLSPMSWPNKFFRFCVLCCPSLTFIPVLRRRVGIAKLMTFENHHVLQLKSPMRLGNSIDSFHSCRTERPGDPSNCLKGTHLKKSTSMCPRDTVLAKADYSQWHWNQQNNQYYFIWLRKSQLLFFPSGSKQTPANGPNYTMVFHVAHILLSISAPTPCPWLCPESLPTGGCITICTLCRLLLYPLLVCELKEDMYFLQICILWT